MDEYIKREEAIKIAESYRPQHESSFCRNRGIADYIAEDISMIPSAEVATVRHARWIGCNGEIVDWDENNPGCPRHSCCCSICKSWLTASDEYPVIAYCCPNCGAKMDGGAD